MIPASTEGIEGRAFGRYVVYDEIAVGGMAAVHLGRLMGPAGFSRTLAIKRLHPQFARDQAFVEMFLDEARLASRINHPNVVGSLDIVSENDELLLVMEYVHGETLVRLLRDRLGKRHAPPVDIVASVLVGVLHGLHAAHTAVGEGGGALGIVHRDVSPQNIIVGVDGVARVLDFGVAKATTSSQTTSQGQVKGKLAYMSPEQLRGAFVDARTDVFAAGVVLWECLTERRLFHSDDLGALVGKLLATEVVPPSQYNPRVPPGLDEIVLRALQRDPDNRFQSAQEFAEALERTIAPARSSVVAEWVAATAGPALAARKRKIESIEISSTHTVPTPPHLTRNKGPGQGRPTKPGGNEEPTQAALLFQASGAADGSRLPSVHEPPHPSGAGSRRRRWAWASLAVLALLVSLLALVLGGSLDTGPSGEPRGDGVAARAAAHRGQRAPTGEPRASQSPGATPAEPFDRPGATPGVSDESGDDGAGEDQAGASSPAEAAPHGVARRHVPQAAPCDPPYRIDDKGIRRILPECL